MSRILATLVLLLATLALNGCGMPYGYGNLLNDYGYGLNGYGGGYGGGYGCAPGYAGMGLPMPVPIDPGYGGGYVQQPYYQGDPYQGQTSPYGTYPGPYTSNQYRHRHHDPNQPLTDPNNPATDPTRTGNHPGGNWTNHHRSGQIPTQAGTTTGTTGTTGPANFQRQHQLNNATGQIANGNQSSRAQFSGPGRYVNPNQRAAGPAAFQRSQGSFQSPRMGYNQPSGGYRAPLGQAPAPARTAAPMMSAPQGMAMPRAAVGAARPTQAAPPIGPIR